MSLLSMYVTNTEDIFGCSIDLSAFFTPILFVLLKDKLYICPQTKDRSQQ
jgi:hypothetical protein